MTDPLGSRRCTDESFSGKKHIADAVGHSERAGFDMSYSLLDFGVRISAWLLLRQTYLPLSLCEV